MHPVIWKIPGVGIEIPGYGLMLMIGFLLSIWWAARRAERSGANPDVILNCGFIALVGGIFGSRLMYVVHYWEQFAHRGSPWAVALAVIDIRQGGVEVYGGFIVVVLAVLFYLWRWGHSVRWYLDIAAPSAALGMAIGRLGCFLNGCCFGGVCDLPWAVKFPYGSPASQMQWETRKPGAGLPAELLAFGAVEGQPLPREMLRLTEADLAAGDRVARALEEARTRLKGATDPQEQARLSREVARLESRLRPQAALRAQLKRHDLSLARLKEIAQRHRSLAVHPTQLYSAVTLGLLAALLSALYWRRTHDGQVILTMLLIEPWTRWVLELIRADNPQDVGGLITISQFLGICLSLAGLAGLLRLRKWSARSPRARLWEPPPQDREKKPRVKPA